MSNGWIKISRDLPDHWLWQDAERLKWWLDLIFMAQWEDKQWMHDSHRFILRRGQIVASVSYLVERWKRSKPTVINFLKQLEQDGMIERETLYRQTPIITICNYESYQDNVNPTLDTIKNLDPISNRKVDMQNQSLTGCKHENSRCKDNDGVDTIVDTINDPIVYPIVDTNKESKEINIIKHANACTSFGNDAKAAKAKVDFSVDLLLKFFNAEMDKADAAIPRARNISGQRLKMINARIKEYGKDAVADVIRKAAKSDFLNGGGHGGFVASFDWMMKPNNFIKILEGNYDDRPKQTPLTTTTNGYEIQTTQNTRGADDAAERKRKFAEHIKKRMSGAYDDEPDISGNY